MATTEVIGGTEVRFGDGYSRLSTDDERLDVPFKSYKIVDGGLVLLTTETGSIDGGTFTIPRDEQNVVRLDPTLELDWVVDVDEDHAERVDGYEHKQFFCVGDRVIPKTDSGRFFEIDPASGAIDRSWGSGEFVVGDAQFALRAPIQSVREDTETVYLLATSSAYGTTACAVDSDGVERWRYTDSTDAFEIVPDGDTVTIVRGRSKNVVLDAETGERLN